MCIACIIIRIFDCIQKTFRKYGIYDMYYYKVIEKYIFYDNTSIDHT